MKTKKTSKGFTLLEAVIALAIWSILSLSVIFVWQYTAERSSALIARQHAFENARGSMDVIIMNLQMARTIELTVGPNYTLQRLRVNGRRLVNNVPQWHNFEFTFNSSARPTDAIYRVLRFGGLNEFTAGIADIRVRPYGGTMHITVVTACEYPIVLEGSVDIRHKALTFIQR